MGPRAGRRAKTARRQIASFVLLAIVTASLLFAISARTRLAARTLVLLPSFFAVLPNAPIDAATAPPVREVVELDPIDGFVRAHVYRPAHGRHPALVLTLGLGPAPPDDPRVVRLLDGLARSGLAVMLVQSEALDGDRLFPDLPRALIEAVTFALAQPYVRPDRVGLIGFSVGGSLAILAATDPAIRDRLRLVESFGGYDRLEDAVLSVATHTLDDARQVRHWEPDIVAQRHLADALLADLDDQDEAAQIRDALDGSAMPPDPAAPSPAGRATYGLLSTRDRAAGRRYFDALPEQERRDFTVLSPLPVVPELRARLFVMYDRDDPLLPFTGSRAICVAASLLNPYCSRFAIFQHVDPKRGGNPLTISHDTAELYMHVFALLQRLQ